LGSLIGAATGPPQARGKPGLKVDIIFIRAYVAMMAPFRANSIETAAHNAVHAILRGEGSSAFNWNKPGDFQHKFAISTDPVIQKAIIDASREVTGV